MDKTAPACYRKAGSRAGEVAAVGILAEVWHVLGRHEEASEYLGQSLALPSRSATGATPAERLRLLAAWHSDAGSHAEALGLAEAATATAYDSGRRKFEALAVQLETGYRLGETRAHRLRAHRLRAHRLRAHRLRADALEISAAQSAFRGKTQHI